MQVLLTVFMCSCREADRQTTCFLSLSCCLPGPSGEGGLAGAAASKAQGNIPGGAAKLSCETQPREAGSGLTGAWERRDPYSSLCVGLVEISSELQLPACAHCRPTSCLICGPLASYRPTPAASTSSLLPRRRVTDHQPPSTP